MSLSKPSGLLLNQFLPYRLVNLANRVSLACADIYRTEFDLSIPEWRILAQLAEQDNRNARDIGKATFMDKSTVSRAVQQLLSKNLITKQKSDQDQRSSVLTLSGTGQALYQQIAPNILAWEAELISALDTSEYRDLMRILDKLDNQVLKMAKP